VDGWKRFGLAFRSRTEDWRDRLRRALQRVGADDWSVLLQRRHRIWALTEQGIFCLALAFIARYPLHVAILQWIFLTVALFYISYAAVIAIMGETDFRVSAMAGRREVSSERRIREICTSGSVSAVWNRSYR
jgi:hypothetical protein